MFQIIKIFGLIIGLKYENLLFLIKTFQKKILEKSKEIIRKIPIRTVKVAKYI
jgi:hypothetical protein